MPMPACPMQGGCLCGAVRFEVSQPPLLTFVCHCRDCQKMSAAPYSLAAAFAADAFRLVRGAPEILRRAGSRRQHAYCAACHCGIYAQVDGTEARVNLRAPLFDDTSWIVPQAEVMTRDALPWALCHGIPRFEGYPTRAEAAALLAT